MEASAQLRGLESPVVVIAFSGWSDAATAASDAVDFLQEHYACEPAYAIDPDDFYDFQVTRPVVTMDVAGPQLTWPTTEVLVSSAGEEIVLVAGPEPSYRWDAFCQLIIEVLEQTSPRLVVVMGALLADALHNRPLPVSITSNDQELQQRTGIIASGYEGPTGMTGILAHRLAATGLPVASVWVSVPHYVASSPNPKATLALLQGFETITGEHLNLQDLPELAKAWERSADEVSHSDPAIEEYVAALTEEQDETDLPEASGDAIAAEFERYLRKREA